MNFALPLLRPLDVLRSSVLRLGAPVLKPLYADRERRVFWLGVLSVTVALVSTLGAPVVMLALGPIVLGVPHLVADLRYLVVRPQLHREWGLWIAAPLLMTTSIGLPPALGFFAAVPLVVLSDAPALRKLAVMLGCAGLTYGAWAWPYEMQLGLLQVHNVVAIALWWWWRPRPWSHFAVIALTALGAAFLLTTGDQLVASWWAFPTATSFGDFISETVPFLEAPWGARAVLTFAFLQAVHYALWLRLIPDDDRTRPAPRTFRASYAALRDDFGGPVLAVVVVLAIALAAWAFVDLSQARVGYLRLAAFHGYLELGIAARWLARGRLAR